MDPRRRIAEARDLNNNLMRWRVAEGIDLEIIRRQRVLVLGMGTLGCGVVRTLMVRTTSPLDTLLCGAWVSAHLCFWTRLLRGVASAVVL